MDNYWLFNLISIPGDKNQGIESARQEGAQGKSCIKHDLPDPILMAELSPDLLPSKLIFLQCSHLGEKISFCCSQWALSLQSRMVRAGDIPQFLGVSLGLLAPFGTFSARCSPFSCLFPHFASPPVGHTRTKGEPERDLCR